MEIMNEYTFSMLTIFMLIFSDYVNDPYGKYNYGWVFNAIIFLNIFINFYGMIHKTISTLLRYLKRTINYIRCRLKQGHILRKSMVLSISHNKKHDTDQYSTTKDFL